MKNAVLLSTLGVVAGLGIVSVIVWQFRAGEIKDVASAEPLESVGENESSQEAERSRMFWSKLWLQDKQDAHKTQLGCIFTLERRFYDVIWAKGRRYRLKSSKKPAIGDKNKEFNDEIREKRASSLITYFCIFLLVLSLVRAAVDMTSNLKKIKDEQEADNFTIDSRRCSLHDFKIAQNILKKRALTRQSTVDPAHPLIRSQQRSLDPPTRLSQEKLNKIPEGSVDDNSPTKKSRFSTTGPPPFLRRCSVPAGMQPFPPGGVSNIRRQSIESQNEEDLMNHSPETKRRMRMIYRH